MCVVIKESTEDKALTLLSWTGPFQGNERLGKEPAFIMFLFQSDSTLGFSSRWNGEGKKGKGNREAQFKAGGRNLLETEQRDGCVQPTSVLSIPPTGTHSPKLPLTSERKILVMWTQVKEETALRDPLLPPWPRVRVTQGSSTSTLEGKKA